MTAVYEAWLAESAGAMQSTVVHIRATSEKDAYSKVRAQYPDMIVRGVYETDPTDPGLGGIMGKRS